MPFLISFYAYTRFSSERDNYIQINWNNIDPDAWTNFKQFVSHVSMFSTPYDYNSILHYSPTAFAIDKSVNTIIPMQYAPYMGQRKGKWYARGKYPQNSAKTYSYRQLIIFRLLSG
jgi:hypothetical protein